MKIVLGILRGLAFLTVLFVAAAGSFLDSIGPSQSEVAIRPEASLAPPDALFVERSGAERFIGFLSAAGGEVWSDYETSVPFAAVEAFYAERLVALRWRENTFGSFGRQWCHDGLVAFVFPTSGNRIVAPGAPAGMTRFEFGLRGAEIGRSSECFGGPPRRATSSFIAVGSFVTYLVAAAILVRRSRRLRGPRVRSGAGLAHWAPALAWLPYAVIAFGVGPHIWLPEPVVWLGIAFIVGGIVFALWALFTINRHFSFELEVHRDHVVVRSGPYRFVRHPIYMGLLVHTLGAFLATGNLLFLGGSTFVTLPLLYLRARTEERLLREQLGPSYDTYARDVGMLLPFVGRRRA